MKEAIWIWKDCIDKNYFLVGVQTATGPMEFIALAGFFTDTLYDLFGHDFTERCHKMPCGVPTKLTVDISFDV